MKTRLGVAIASAIAATSASARGAPAPVDLTWSAPAECPERASVEAEIARVLEGGSRATVTVVARVDVRYEGEWIGALTTTRDGERGERELRAPSCELLAKATALALALAVTARPPAAPKPSSAPPPPEPAPPSPPPPAAPAIVGPPEVPPAPARKEAPSAPSGPPRSRIAVGAGLAFDSSVLPNAGVGPELWVAWRPSRVELEVGALYLAGQHRTLADRGGATFYLATLAARVCYAFALGVTLSPCLSMELGALGAASNGPSTSSAASPWVAPGFAFRARWPESARIAAVADVGGAVALDRPEFVLDNVRHVYQAAPFTARGTFGVEARFP